MSWIKKKLNKIFSKELVKGVDYEYHNEGYPNLSVKILSGKYKDVIFTYSDVVVKDEDSGQITFNILVDEPTFTFTKKFNKIAEDVFVQMLRESIENYKDVRQEVLNDDENRIDYVEESTPERIVREKGTSTSSE